jgi:hypothetical protein
VEFILGVQGGGNFRFFINIETLPGPTSAANSGQPGTKTSATKLTENRKQQ